MRRSLLALVGAVSLMASPAFANPITIVVPVSPADLESRESVAALYQRVEDAAASVCVEIMRGSSPAAYTSRRSCVRDLMDKALDGASISAVSEYHAEVRTGQPALRTLASR